MGVFFDLSKYAHDFEAVCKSKFGRRYDFAIVESFFAEHRQGKKTLSLQDINVIFDPTNTPFGKYWVRPSASRLATNLGSGVKLGPFPLDRKKAFEDVLHVVGTTFIASVILRFVQPNEFGVLSAPVINLLQVRTASPSEFYIAYCDELRDWQRKYGIPSIAQTEVALWTFHEVSRNSSWDKKLFDSDRWVQQRRFGHNIKDWREHDRLDQAEMFVPHDPLSAAQIAGVEYERLLRIAAQRWYPDQPTRGERWAERIIAKLKKRGHIDMKDELDLNRIWCYRNRALHSDLVPPTVEEVEDMIRTIRRVCVPWVTRPSIDA